MTKEDQPKKILVIRSATRILNKTLVLLREEFPGCHITVLVPESAKESMEQESQVDEVRLFPINAALVYLVTAGITYKN